MATRSVGANWRRYLSEYGEWRYWLALGLLGVVLRAAALLAVPMVIRLIIDNYLARNDTELIWRAAIAMIALSALASLLMIAVTQINTRAVKSVIAPSVRTV